MAQKSKLNVTYIVVGVLVVVVLAGWAVVSLRSNSSSDSSSASYTATVQGATVVAGKPAANKVDVYEDFLCPFCKAFEARDGGKMSQAIDDGKIQVVYHPVDILNRNTTPTGYSLRAANASLCAAEAGVFAQYHQKLFAEAPSEGSAGLSNQDLIAKGQQVGAPGSFAQCVTQGKFNKAVSGETLRATKDPSIRAEGSDGFGTPTVIANGKFADISDDSWLTNLTK